MSGRMSQGLAAGMGANVRRTRPAVDEGDETDLVVADVPDGWRHGQVAVRILTEVSVCSHNSPDGETALLLPQDQRVAYNGRHLTPRTAGP